MKTVYIVEYGDVDYPDEGLVDIFSTQVKAITFAKNEAEEEVECRVNATEWTIRVSPGVGSNMVVSIINSDDTIMWWIIQPREVK